MSESYDLLPGILGTNHPAFGGSLFALGNFLTYVPCSYTTRTFGPHRLMVGPVRYQMWRASLWVFVVFVVLGAGCFFLRCLFPI